MQETVFTVTGMKCEGCVAAVKQALEKVAGFESSLVDLESKTATVVGEIDPQSVCAMLGEAGYPSVVKSG